MSSKNQSLKDTPIEQTSVSLLEGLATTRAIRRYTNEPIPETHLRDILFSATRAPSGSNRQPFRFMVLTDGDRATQAKEVIAKSAQKIWAEKSVMTAMREVLAPIRLRRNLAWRGPCATTSTTSPQCQRLSYLAWFATAHRTPWREPRFILRCKTYCWPREPWVMAASLPAFKSQSS